MGLYRGPKIVTDGLILALDSASPRSYPGSGSTWYDISGNGSHFTMQGTITATGEYGSFTNFTANTSGNGNKFYRETYPVNLKTNQGGNGLTVLVWAKSTGGSGWRKLVGNTDGDNYVDLYQSPSGYWAQECSSTLYVDGVNYGNGVYNMTGTGWHLWGAININSGLVTAPTGNFTIGNEPGSSNSYPWPGYISVVLLYNRVLNTDEMLKIYNAQKTRFGL